MSTFQSVTRGTVADKVKHFVRAMLLSVESMCMSQPLRGLDMETIQRWLPDQNDHTAPLQSWKTDAVEALGLNPLMVGCWTCLMHDVPPGGLQHLLTAPFTKLWAPVRRYCADRDPGDEARFPPGPRIIHQQMDE